MQKINPKSAKDSPLAASLLGAVLVKSGRNNRDPEQEQAGMELLQTAQQNQDKMPTLSPSSKLSEMIKQTKMEAQGPET